MMRLNSKYKASILFLTSMLILFVSCDRDNNHPGYTYYPDMVDSRAYESFSENPNFDNSSTLREPVEGTVPRGYTPLPYTKDLEDRVKAGNELINPLIVSEETRERGQVLYERFCIHCHGEQGNGQGILYTKKLYPFPPASLVNDRVKNLKDGEIFHSITYGYGVMGAHGTMMKPVDRWNIILYIREELQQE